VLGCGSVRNCRKLPPVLAIQRSVAALVDGGARAIHATMRQADSAVGLSQVQQRVMGSSAEQLILLIGRFRRVRPLGATLVTARVEVPVESEQREGR
jgi:hypothetical protein